MTRFLVDAQLPPALARFLETQGYIAEHVFDFGGDGTTDNAIWMRALSTGAIIISKDEDFSLRAIREVNGPRVIWVRAGNSRRVAVLELFARLLPVIQAALDRGDRIIEVS